MKKWNLIILFFILISCSSENTENNLSTDCESNWNGKIRIKRYNESLFKDYKMDGAFYNPSEQYFIFTESNENLNIYHSVHIVLSKPNLDNGNYTHTIYPTKNESFEFRFGVNIYSAINSDLSFSIKPNEINTNASFLTIEKKSNCFNISYEIVTMNNDSISGSYSGGFIEKQEWSD